MRKFSAALAAALLAVAPCAQTAPCISDNDSTNAATSAFFGILNSAPGVHGWQINPQITTTAASIRVYTGNNYMNQTGNFAKLDIYDDVAGLPGQSLGSGTFRLQPGFSWLGCNFDTPIPLQSGNFYWVVMTEPGWTNAPLQSFGGNNLPAYRYNTVTNTWFPYNSFEALKYRIYCSPLDSQGVTAFGAACPNAAGSLGTAFTNATPTVGNASFQIEGTGFTPGSVIVGVAGINSAWPSLPLPGAPGCFVSSSADFASSLQAGVGDVRAVQPDGHVELPVPIPSSGSLVGFFLSVQFAALDLAIGTPLPFVTSNALQITIY